MSVTINGTNGLTFNDASTQTTAATGFGFKNRIINGAMVIDQRNAGAAVTPSASSQYLIDRFNMVGTQASKLTFQQVSDAPTGFVNSTKITVASAATPSAGDQFRFNQPIEGFNIADLGFGTANAQTITVSFRAKASIAGTYSVALWNGANGRSYVTTVSLTTSWATYSFTVSGDITGTWATNNTVGIELVFDLGGGSNWATSTLNAWQASNFFKASGSVSLVSNAAATLNITGVQLEKGSTATSFDYRPYGTELALCQRYFIAFTNTVFGGANNRIATGSGASTTIVRFGFPFPVAMRSAPSVTMSGTPRAEAGSAISITSASSAGMNIYGAGIDCSAASGLTAGTAYMMDTGSGGYSFSSEL